MIIKKINTILKLQIVFIMCVVTNANAQTVNQDYDDDYAVFEYYLSFFNSTAASANHRVIFASSTSAEPIVAAPPTPTPAPTDPHDLPLSVGPTLVGPTPVMPDHGNPPPPSAEPTLAPDDNTPPVPVGPTPVTPDHNPPQPPSAEPTPLPNGGNPTIPEPPAPPMPVALEPPPPPIPVEPEPPTPPLPTYQECYQEAQSDFTTCQNNAYRDRGRLPPDANYEESVLRNIQLINQINFCENDRANQLLICYCYTGPMITTCNDVDIQRTVCINTAYTNYNNCQRLAATGPAAQACEAIRDDDIANCESTEN